MSSTFPDGTFAWRAVEKDGRVRCKDNGDLASALVTARLREFRLVPEKRVQKPLVRTECAIAPGMLEFYEDGGFKMCKPEVLSGIRVVRRREFDGGKFGELWFIGLEMKNDGLPTCWVHVRPGFTEVTLREPSHADSGTTRTTS